MGSLLLIHAFGFAADGVVEVATLNLNIGRAAHEKGMEWGVDEGIMFFFHNGIFALAQISLLFIAALSSPKDVEKFPVLIRRWLVGKNTGKVSKADAAMARSWNVIPSVRAISDVQLKSVCMLLHVAPLLILSIQGFILGLLVPAFIACLGLPLAMAVLLPHGIVEIPAIILASTIPFAAFSAVQKDAENGCADEVFRGIRQAATSRSLIVVSLIVACALLVAGMMEAHVVDRIVKMLGE